MSHGLCRNDGPQYLSLLPDVGTIERRRRRRLESAWKKLRGTQPVYLGICRPCQANAVSVDPQLYLGTNKQIPGLKVDVCQRASLVCVARSGSPNKKVFAAV